ncbi:hypothetical protein BJF83_20645 [Nocardiopsis sp. CNR-923]|uniref:hypothetical protein n=1 Tax=Nocardiopsis sp. CNR-923 TaxID=1904965 RepID=UPI00095B3C3C|nr:hypothetical protein [Nocardiopsis sp. CNR-923]OLT26575.1 hypothetical protein BJF83_20645 [Nocardiopsis sp. CNR-923]
MHDNDSTYRDPLDAVEEELAIQAHSPRFWDVDSAELAVVDPAEHPSCDVHQALTGEDGWDDPAEAAAVLEETVITDARLLASLSDTPVAVGRPLVARSAADVLIDRSPTPGEELHEALLALVPVDGSGLWPAAADYTERGAAA